MHLNREIELTKMINNIYVELKIMPEEKNAEKTFLTKFFNEVLNRPATLFVFIVVNLASSILGYFIYPLLNSGVILGFLG